MTRLEIIVASTRPNRVGGFVGEWFAEQARRQGFFDVSVSDLAALDLPFLDEAQPAATSVYEKPHTKSWSATISAADAVVLVMPEYNAGFSAPLKNALDFLYREWFYKPVGFVSYGFASAGANASQMLKPVLTAMRMVPVADSVAVPLKEVISTESEINPNESMKRDALTMLEELAKLSAVLKPLHSAPVVSHSGNAA